MNTRKTVFPQTTLLFSVAFATALFPSFTKVTVVKVFSKALSIQTSKSEPPRVAFDELYKMESFSEWNLLNSKTGSHHLSENKSSFVATSAMQNLLTRKIVLSPMIFSRQRQVPDEGRAWVNDLPMAQQKRVIASQEKYRTLEETWENPTFQQQASKVIEDYKSTESFTENSRVLIQAHLPNGSEVDEKSVHTADVQVRAPETYLVSGQIELSGLPAGPQWKIEVAHYEEGVRKAPASIDLKKSTYQIQVPDLNGTVYAQVTDQKTGQVLGEGSYRLSQYTRDQIGGRAKIVISPTNNSFASNMGSFYSNTRSLTGPSGVHRGKAISANVLLASVDSEGRTDEAGTYRFEQVMKGSWGLLRTEAKDYYPSIFLVRSGEEKRLPLFPEKMIGAMKQIIAEQAVSSQFAETGSIIWGQATQDGKSVAGVEVGVEFSDQFQAVYFNSLLIPDPSLKATSENGFFAFVNLPAGFHSLVSSRGSAYLSHANVIVDDNSISIAEMESTLRTEKVEVKVFDAFQGSPQEAHLELQSLSEQLEVKGFAEVDMQPISRLSFLRTHPLNQGYYEALYLYEDANDYIHVPLISKAWLTSLQASRKISINPETGTIVGFAAATDFEVYLSHAKEYSSENIIYFTAQGELSLTGVAGGGFILFNVPTGVQSVVLAEKNSDMIQTQVLPVDESALAILKFR